MQEHIFGFEIFFSFSVNSIPHRHCINKADVILQYNNKIYIYLDISKFYALDLFEFWNLKKNPYQKFLVVLR